jgi:flagellar motor switch protein FliM
LATSQITNGAAKAGGEISSYDFQQAGKLNETHVQALSGLNEGFVRNLEFAFSNSLRTGFELKLLGIDEMVYAQFAAQVPAGSHVTSVLFQPQHTLGGIQMDLPLVFPMLDLMLGGSGTSAAPERGLTEIEDCIMQDVVHIICAELERTWKPLDVTVSAGERQAAAQLPKMLPAHEKVLILHLEGKVLQSEGRINVFFPSGTAAAMLRKLFKAPAISARPSTPSAGLRIQERLLECTCSVELTIPGIKLSLAELMQLQPGKLLDLGVALNAPALLSLEGQDWFESFPVRSGSFRAAKLANRARRRSQNG